MPGSWNPTEHPNLSVDDYIVTSPLDRRYNCIAWAAGINTRWWWPDPFDLGTWPTGVPRTVTISAFIDAYRTLGYAPCADGTYVVGKEKVALFAIRDASGQLDPTHAALQLPDGRWTSKMGPFEDIAHFTLECLEDHMYGSVVCYLQRDR